MLLKAIKLFVQLNADVACKFRGVHGAVQQQAPFRPLVVPKDYSDRSVNAPGGCFGDTNAQENSEVNVIFEIVNNSRVT